MGFSLGSPSLPAAVGSEALQEPSVFMSLLLAGPSLQQVGTLLEDPGGISQRVQAGGSQLHNKELTGLRNPFSSHRDLGRKGKKGEVRTCSGAGRRTSTQNHSCARLRAEHLGSRVDPQLPIPLSSPSSPAARCHLAQVPPGPRDAELPLCPPRPPSAPCPTSPGRGCRLSFLRRLWGMGLLCMSEPLKEQPSDVLIFTLTFPALGALGCL